MTLTEKMLSQLRTLIRPLKTKVANSIASAVIENVDDSKKLQTVQASVLSDKPLDDCQRFQEFGFNSVPLPGAEVVIVFPNGDQTNGLVVATADRRFRPTDWEPGEAGTFNAFDAMMRHKEDGTTEITGGGVAAALATKADLDALIGTVNDHIADYNSHLHPGVTTGGGSSAVTTSTSGTAASSAGTTKLKGE